MAEDLGQLQSMREKALSIGDEAAVARYDARIAAAEPGIWDVVKDIPASAVSGILRGVTEDLPSTPSDLYDLGSSASVLQHKWQGDSPEKLAEMRKSYAGDNPFTGLANIVPPSLKTPYKPTTPAGEWTEDVTRFIAGGAPKKIIRDVVMPYLGGKAGAAAGAQLGPEEAQLLSAIGGVGGSGGTEGAARATIRSATPERIEDIRTLRREGVELTGGQATGSNALQYMEAGPYAGKAQNIERQQAQQYTRAALERAGIYSDRADPATLANAQDSFGREYEGLIQANNGIVLDPQLINELEVHGGRLEDLKGDSSGVVYKTFNRIVEAAHQYGGVIPPDVFQQINGEMSAALKRAHNSPELAALSDTLREFRDSMFASMERNGQQGVAAQARDLNNRYRNFKIVEKAMRSTGAETSQGFITPGNLASAVKQTESITDWAQSRGDFDDLAKAGYLTKPLPTSGTAGRSLVGAVIPGMATGAGLVMNGQTLAGLGTIAGSVSAPFLGAVPGRVLTSRPVQTSIVNRATGLNSDWVNPLSMPPIVNQAVTEDPVPVEMPPPIPQSQLRPQQQGALEPLTDDPLDQRRQVAGLPLPDMLAGMVGRRMGRV